MGITLKTDNNKSINLKAYIELIEPEGTIEITENGIHNVKDYAEANVNVQTNFKLQRKEITPSTTEQTITAAEEYDALSEVIVKAVDNSIDSNIKAENIKKDISILGVTGTLEEGIVPSGNLDITENGTYDVTNYASANVNVANSGGGAAPTKGLIIHEVNSNGYPTRVSFVGMSEIPSYMFYYAFQKKTGGGSFLSKCPNIEIPNEITYIGQAAFYGGTALKTIKLPDSLQFIGSSSFSDCSILELEKLPNDLKSLGSSAFYNDKKITIKTIPRGITAIEQQTFYKCTELTEQTFEGNITSIGNNAYYNCTNLVKMVFPNITSVPTIYNLTLYGSGIHNGNGYIYVPDDLVDSFKTAKYWSDYANQIKPLSELSTE